jgi:hypothetical protein
MIVSKKADANVVMSCIISPCGKTAAKRGIEVGGKIEVEKVSVLYREGRLKITVPVFLFAMKMEDMNSSLPLGRRVWKTA